MKKVFLSEDLDEVDDVIAREHGNNQIPKIAIVET